MQKEVSIQQGTNGVVHTIRMPVYMKLMDFLTRRNHYILLTGKILKGKKTDKEKINALFNWTRTNIKPVPLGFSVVDDHVDNIIIRGYGTPDQSADVFTTLAAFAGFKGGIYLVKISSDDKIVHALSLIEIGGRFILFDTYYGFMFYNRKGEFASLEDIIKDLSIIKRSSKGFKVKGIYDYSRFFEHIVPVERLGWTKADLQMLSRRVVYMLGRLLRVAEPSRVFYGESYS